MGRYTYRIHEPSTDTTYNCKHEPDGWGSYGVTFGRETNISNVVKGYVSSWKFVKEDAAWLKERLVRKGPNNRLRLSVYDTMNDMRTSEVVIYEGDIDMTQAQFDAFTFSAPTSSGGFFKSLENSWDKEFEVPFDSYVKLDGAVFYDINTASGLSTSNDKPNFMNIGSVGRLSFIHMLDFKGESELNEKCCNDTALKYFQLKISDPTNLIGFIPEDAGKNDSFFMCDVRKLDGLSIRYGIHYRFDISEMTASHGMSYYDKASCMLDIYGIPRKRLDDNSAQSHCYILERVSNMGDASVQYGDRQFYSNISEGVIDIRPESSGGAVRCSYDFDFDGEFNIRDMDVSDASGGLYDGMYFFLVVSLTLGYSGTDNSDMLQANAATVIKSYIQRNDIEISYQFRLNENRIVCARSAEGVFRSLIASVNGVDNQSDTGIYSRTRTDTGRYKVIVDVSGVSEKWSGDMLTGSLGMRLFRASRNVPYSMHGKITTTLGDFLKYVYAVYGCQFGVDFRNGTYTVFIAQFGEMYSPSSVIGDIGIYNGLAFSVMRDYLYTTIRIGYKSENEVFNGEREYNNEQTWTTPNKEIEETELDLTCPYSASSKAIETYLYKNYRNYEDKPEDDGNIYIMETRKDGMSYDSFSMHVIDRKEHIVSGIDFPDTQWNVKFTPKRMLIAHKVELNSYFAFDEGKEISLETCDLNRELVSTDNTLTREARNSPVIESEPVNITYERVFVPLSASFRADTGKEWIPKIEGNRLGVIRVKYKGVFLAGYIAPGEASVTVNPIKASESDFTILLTDKNTP